MMMFEDLRKQMVEEQIARRGIKDARLLDSMEVIPRHRFVPDEYQHSAYQDCPLPIGYGQTISQPYIVALMTDLLELKGDERVLEVGSGSGYQAAILAKMAMEVHSVELVPDLATRAEQTLADLGLDNVHCHFGDGSQGWPPAEPYAGILVAAAAPKTPQVLLDQLEDGGRLVLPVGGRGMQNLQVWVRKGKKFKSKSITTVAFVPLRGEQGWNQKKW